MDGTTFGAGFASGFVSEVVLDENQKILAGGSFANFAGTARGNMTRINADGTDDATFNTGGAGFNQPILSLLTRASDNRIWAGGQFFTYNGATVPGGIILLNSDGSRNTTIFTPSTGTNLQVNSIGAVPSSSDIIIAGNFTSYNGTTGIGRIARISEAGVLNTTFNTNIGTGANGSILRILVTSAGNIFLVGSFTQFNGTTVNGIAKLDINGNLDAAFAAQTGSAAGTAAVRAIIEQSDGSLIVGGDFTSWNGTAGVNRLVRLNADGTRNGSFTAATNNPVVSLRRLPGSDAFVAGGTFATAGTTVASLVTRQSIAAFSASGVLDANFLPNSGFTAVGSFVNQLAFQSDGKLVVGGSFTAYNGATRNRIARLCGDLSVAGAQTATITSISATNQFALGSTECTILARVLPNGATPVSGNVTVQTFVDPSVQSFNGTVYAQRHFEITPGSGSTGRVTLYFTQADFDAFNAVPNGQDLPTGPSDLSGISNIRIMKFAGSSTGGTGNPADYAGAGEVINPLDADIVWNAVSSKWEVSFNVVGFSGFFLQTSTFLLPVTLKDFTAKAVGDRAELRWVTASEQNSKQFVVERSLNGADFVAIGRVNAAGNSSGDRSYGFNDDLSRLPHNGTVYYRLQMKDVDGSAAFSRVATVKSGKVNIGASLLGNPVGGVAKVLFQSVGSDRLTIRVIDSRGQVVMQTNQQIAAGANQFSLNTAGLAKGIYVLEIQGNSNDRSALRMIKE